MSDTTDRGYPYPSADSPISVHTDIQQLAEACDAGMASEEAARVAADNALMQDIRELINHEIIDVLEDAKTYTDAEIERLEQRLTALIDSSQPDTSQVPVIGPWAVAATQPPTTQPVGYGWLAGNGSFPPASPSIYTDMRNWTQLEVSLLDSTFHTHNWENVIADDWVITYNGGLHSATWRAKSEAQRNGDASVIISVDWVDGTTTDPAELGTDGFINARLESNPHFPI